MLQRDYAIEGRELSTSSLVHNYKYSVLMQSEKRIGGYSMRAREPME